MGLKVYIATITPNVEIKKRTQRILMILDSMHINYESIDITQPGKEEDREFMKTHGKAKDGTSVPLPPQIFNESQYCGDYDDFDNANENCQLKPFLKLEVSDSEVNGVVENGYITEHSTKEAEMNGVHDEEVGEENVENEDATVANNPEDEEPAEDQEEKAIPAAEGELEEEGETEKEVAQTEEAVEEEGEGEEAGEEKEGETLASNKEESGDIEREEGEVSADEAEDVEEKEAENPGEEEGEEKEEANAEEKAEDEEEEIIEDVDVPEEEDEEGEEG